LPIQTKPNQTYPNQGIPFSEGSSYVGSIRTSAKNAETQNLKENAENKNGDRLRLLARVLRDVLRAEKFETTADLVDAFKTRLPRLHVPYAGDDVAAAIRLVESNTPTINPWRDRS